MPPASLRGEVFDRVSNRQQAAVDQELPDGLLRYSVEPGLDGSSREITVWISTWDDARRTVLELEQQWRRFLRRTFPEGETPEG